MPNWTSNSITVYGEPDQLTAFLEAIAGDNGPLDFNRIIPMPELLRRTASGFRFFDGREARSWYVSDDQNLPPDQRERPFTPEEEAELAEIGFASWYEWSVANWGTKWNACSAEVHAGNLEYGPVEITFETAWDAPIPVLKEIVNRFPDLEIHCRWRHEDEDPYPHSLAEAA